jgi:hypothetical protein
MEDLKGYLDNYYGNCKLESCDCLNSRKSKFGGIWVGTLCENWVPTSCSNWEDLLQYQIVNNESYKDGN